MRSRRRAENMQLKGRPNTQELKMRDSRFKIQNQNLESKTGIQNLKSEVPLHRQTCASDCRLRADNRPLTTGN